MASIINYEWIK